MTEDAYFASPDTRTTYARQLAAVKMRESEVGALAPELRETTWNRVVSGVQAAANVKVLDPAFR